MSDLSNKEEALLSNFQESLMSPESISEELFRFLSEVLYETSEYYVYFEGSSVDHFISSTTLDEVMMTRDSPLESDQSMVLVDLMNISYENFRLGKTLSVTKNDISPSI